MLENLKGISSLDKKWYFYYNICKVHVLQICLTYQNKTAKTLKYLISSLKSSFWVNLPTNIPALPLCKIKNLTKTKTEDKILENVPMEDLCLFAKLVCVTHFQLSQSSGLTRGSVWSIQQHMLDTTILLYNVMWKYAAFAAVPPDSPSMCLWFAILCLYTDCTKNSHKPPSPLSHWIWSLTFWQPLRRCYHITTTKAALTRALSY